MRRAQRSQLMRTRDQAAQARSDAELRETRDLFFDTSLGDARFAQSRSVGAGQNSHSEKQQFRAARPATAASIIALPPLEVDGQHFRA